jgi:hypothetical protein
VALTSWSLAGASVVLGLFALVALLQHRRQTWVWAAATAPGVAVVLILVNSYGREGIFRAAAFGIPWLAVLAASATPISRLRKPAPLAAIGCAVLAPLTLMSSFGMDGSTLLRVSEYTTYRQLQALVLQKQTGAWILAGPGSYPVAGSIWGLQAVGMPTWMTLGHTWDQGLAVSDAPLTERVSAITSSIVRSSREVGDVDRYVVFAASIREHAKAFGLQDPGDYDRVHDAFASSGCWREVLRNQDTVVLINTREPCQ